MSIDYSRIQCLFHNLKLRKRYDKALSIKQVIDLSEWIIATFRAYKDLQNKRENKLCKNPNYEQ